MSLKAFYLASWPTRQPWLSRILRVTDEDDENEHTARGRRALEYQPAEDRYVDNPNEPQAAGGSVAEEALVGTRAQNEALEDGTNGQAFHVRPSGLQGEENEWRRHTSV